MVKTPSEKRQGPEVRISQNQTGQALNHAHETIGPWLRRLRFKRRLLGGLNEADVWKKISQLNDMYEAALIAERARYDALLEKARKETAEIESKPQL